MSAIDGVEGKAVEKLDPISGRRKGRGISSIFGSNEDGRRGKISPKMGILGGRGGASAIINPSKPFLTIRRNTTSIAPSASFPRRLRRDSAESERRNDNPSVGDRPSSGTASISTNAAPSFVDTDPMSF